MASNKKIKSLAVNGLQGVFHYKIVFPNDADTLIIIAPNGYGKTAFLSLLRDCMSLSLRRAASHTFNNLTVTFGDKSKWVFSRVIDEEKSRVEELRRRRVMYREIPTSWAPPHPATRGGGDYWVTLKRFDRSGKEIEDKAPDLDKVNPRVLSRVLERSPYLSPHTSSSIRDLRTGEVLLTPEAFRRYFTELSADPRIREMLSLTAPNIIWPEISPTQCVFIETQRLLYNKASPGDEGSKSPAPQEEILRQAQSLSTLLQQNYSDYAATSQALDRSFPSRLIARARSGGQMNTDDLRSSLLSVEKKRASLTEAGILVEQTDAIMSTDDELLPKVVDALQIYVEDSQKKLATYDEIYPKISVFRELMSNKLKPKKLSIGRDFGASVSRDKQKLTLEGLSSGEKHEFIMLFKLIFETPANSLVLIDEPEISLHVVWQLEFMSDLRRIQSANPFQSIIATHSPQVFQGVRHLLVDLADQVQ